MRGSCGRRLRSFCWPWPAARSSVAMEQSSLLPPAILTIMFCSRSRASRPIKPIAKKCPTGHASCARGWLPARRHRQLRDRLRGQFDRRLCSASAPTPVVVASVAPAPPVVSLAASAPAQVPASKPDDNDPKTAGDVLNDAAIAALIIQASREAYYTAGHSCPCPYDLARTAGYAATTALIAGIAEGHFVVSRPT